MTENRNMTFLQKLLYLLSKSQKKQLLILGGLLLIGMFFEMAGLGILVPAIGVMLNPDISNKYPAIRPFLKAIGNPTQSQLIMIGLCAMIVVYLVKTLFLAFLSWKQSKFCAELAADLSCNLFRGYLRQPYTFHLQRNSAELLRNTQNEINQFTSVSQSAITLTVELSLLLSVAVMLILVEPMGALIVTVFLGMSSYVFHRLTKNRLLTWGEGRQFLEGQTNQHLLQGLGGVKDLKILGREENFINQFNKYNVRKSKLTTKQITLLQIPRLYLELLAVLGMAGLIIIMVVQKKPLDMVLPTLGIFVAAAFRMIPSVNRIMSSMQAIRYSRPVVDVLYDEFYLIRNSRKILQSPNKLPFTEELRVTNLSFTYPNVTIKTLENITVFVKKGESVGFIGASGSGKSTLVDIILGLLTPESGKISIDGFDIEKNLRGWQDQIGYVPQTIYLTDDSLLHNVAFGISPEDIDYDAAVRAIQAAQMNEFVDSLPEGLETMVGERGVRLSGGQRQRIGIARALYHEPEVLVLDEATSSLDSATEQAVMEAINLLHGEKTILIVAHRLTTLVNCDRIYKLEKGKLIGSGTTKAVIGDSV